MSKYKGYIFLIKFADGMVEIVSESSLTLNGAIRKLYQHNKETFEILEIFE